MSRSSGGNTADNTKKSGKGGGKSSKKKSAGTNKNGGSKSTKNANKSNNSTVAPVAAHADGFQTGATRQRDRGILERMIRHRSVQLQLLQSVAIKKLALQIGLDPKTVTAQTLLEEIEYQFQQTADQSRPSGSRREAWDKLKVVLTNIDEACKEIPVATLAAQQSRQQTASLQKSSQETLKTTNLAQGPQNAVTTASAPARAPSILAAAAAAAAAKPRSSSNSSHSNPTRPLQVTRTLLEGAQHTNQLLSNATSHGGSNNHGHSPRSTHQLSSIPTGPPPAYSRQSNLVVADQQQHHHHSTTQVNGNNSGGYRATRPREDDDMNLSDSDDEDAVLPVAKKPRTSLTATTSNGTITAGQAPAAAADGAVKPRPMPSASSSRPGESKPSPMDGIIEKLMKPTTIAPPPVASQIPLPEVQPILPQILSTQTTRMSFPDDMGQDKFTASQNGHGQFNFEFRQATPTATMKESFKSRLRMWEPFWKPVETLAIGMTSTVEKSIANLDVREIVPVNACSIRFCIEQKLAQRIDVKNWGTSSPPSDGDLRIMMFMLPVALTPKDRKKRADTHLWPRGTHLMFDGRSAMIFQRKQQNHDKSEWKYNSKPLDITAKAIRTRPERSIYHSIQLFSCDPDKYYAGVFLCRYQAPETVYRELITEPSNVQPNLQRLSFDGAKMKALQNISQNKISVLDDSDDDDDEDNGPSEEPGLLVFSLTCPVSKTIMKTPVRGRCCKHWQCFDLANFLVFNVNISGGRWRCAVCEVFLSYRDLQYCALTDAAIHQYSNEASPTVRDRVEFSSLGTYTLLPAKEPRHQKRKQQNGVSSTSNGKAVAVEEIVIE